MKYSPKTQRAINAYGIEACREAFRMNEAGEGASTIALQGPASIKTTRQADAAVNAGSEIAKVERIHVRAYTLEDGHFEFDVSGDEWRAELPAILDCWSLPVRDYQIRAIVKKAASATKHPVLSFQVLGGL